MESFIRFVVGLFVVLIIIGTIIYSDSMGAYEIGMRWVVATAAFFVGTGVGIYTSLKS